MVAEIIDPIAKTRAMAHIETIKAIDPIDGADAIECVTVLGWKVVAQKAMGYKVGDKVIYFEIDSFIPNTVAPFLTKEGKEPKVFNGVPGERLKTVKLRGQLSQGLLMPLPAEMADEPEGTDLTERFNVQKWEQEVPAQLAGMARGNFPAQLRKTDQERIQNVYGRISRLVTDGKLRDEWIIEEKLEGSSMQVARINGEIHVCSRNLSLDLNQEGNSFVDVAKSERLIELLENVYTDHQVIALQGELIGPGIQGNIYKLDKPTFRLFDIYVDGRLITMPEMVEFENAAKAAGFELFMVPIMPAVVSIFSTGVTVDQILEKAQIPSALNPKQLAEGLVFKNVYDGDVSFKAISNAYLLKHG